MGIFRNILGSREIFAFGDEKTKSILNFSVFDFGELAVQVTKEIKLFMQRTATYEGLVRRLGE